MSQQQTDKVRQQSAKPGTAGASAQLAKQEGAKQEALPPEIGGPKGPEPTRYGDWEVKGRCSDF